MALRIAQYELEKLVANGLTREEFESTRDYLMKNVYLLTSTQEAQLGYALDSKWYAIGEYTAYMRDRLTKLTVDEVNGAIRTHLSAKDLSVVIITKDAEGLRDQLVSDAPSAMKYESERPKALLDEDAVIGARKLGIPTANIRITPVGEVFAK
jgi:zinc protease